MKSNHIPREERLRQRISRLELEYDRNIGQRRGNPYLYCKGCGKHSPEISISGHGSGCHIGGIKKEIRHYKLLLWEIQGKDPKAFYYNTEIL